MFERKDFISHAGKPLHWKIECDELSDEDLETLAYVVSRRIQFSSVVGIPRGGVRFADALKKYVSESGPRLLVDDVLTTGLSMDTERKYGDVGVVIFSRGLCPSWIIPIFQCFL